MKKLLLLPLILSTMACAAPEERVGNKIPNFRILLHLKPKKLRSVNSNDNLALLDKVATAVKFSYR